jgi:hypothetical protein
MKAVRDGTRGSGRTVTDIQDKKMPDLSQTMTMVRFFPTLAAYWGSASMTGPGDRTSTLGNMSFCFTPP